MTGDLLMLAFGSVRKRAKITQYISDPFIEIFED
jgi:hypothetical protein